MKGIAKILVFPAAALCLGAGLPEGRPFSWNVGPVIQGQGCQVNVRYDASRLSNAYFLCEIKGVPSTKRVASFSPSLCDEEGYVTHSVEYDLSSFGVGTWLTFRFGLSRKDVAGEVDISDFYLYVEQNEKVRPDTSLLQFVEEGIHEMDRGITVFDPWIDPGHTFSYSDAYRYTGMKNDALLPGRKIGLSSLILEYANPYAVAKKPKAELRFLDHLDEFADVSTSHGGYRSIPLEVDVFQKQGVGVTYRFALRKPLYYSRLDYRASAKPISGEPCFLSADFYLPLREGHDGDLYRYQVFLTGAGAYGDSVSLPQSAYSSRNLFGPCGEAEYCVVVGGEGR
ncbi:MAG: hypothetical protein K6E59_00925 [Bacilli bacterium]|nr:hypothetical protein [Bacilli bacterium]